MPTKGGDSDINRGELIQSPEDMSVNELISILSKYDVDLPPKRLKKHFYVNLYNDHLEYIRKWSGKNKYFTINNCSIIEKIREKQISGLQSPIIQVKKRAVSGDDTFSRNNPFQTPVTSRVKHRIKKIESRCEAVPIDINFGGSLNHESDDTVIDSLSLLQNDSIKISPPIKTSPNSNRKSPRPTTRKIKSPNKKSQVFNDIFLETGVQVSVSQEKIEEKIFDKVILPAKSIIDARERLKDRILLKARSKHTKNTIFKILLILTSFFVLLTSNWIAVDQHKLHYCNTKPVGQRFYSFMPECLECPNNSICESREIVGCAIDYKLKQPALHFFFSPSYLPFPLDQPVCVFDPTLLRESKKARQVDHLLQAVDKIIREFIGSIKCSSTSIPKHMDFIKPNSKILGMPVSLAKEKLNSLIQDKWNKEEFEEYWGLLFEKILQDGGSISSIVDEIHQHRMFTTTSPAMMSLACQLRLAFWDTIVVYSTHLLILSLTLLLLFLMYNSYQQRILESRIIRNVVEDVLEAVHAETDNYHLDSTRHPIPGLSIIQLRDHFLPSRPTDCESSLDDQNRIVYHVDVDVRDRVWNAVCGVVGGDSCVRETSCLIKGETFAVWMWISSSALSPKKRVRSDVGFVAVVGHQNVSISPAKAGENV